MATRDSISFSETYVEDLVAEELDLPRELDVACGQDCECDDQKFSYVFLINVLDEMGLLYGEELRDAAAEGMREFLRGEKGYIRSQVLALYPQVGGK